MFLSGLLGSLPLALLPRKASRTRAQHKSNREAPGSEKRITMKIVVFVTTSKALVTTSVALVTSSKYIYIPYICTFF